MDKHRFTRRGLPIIPGILIMAVLLLFMSSRGSHGPTWADRIFASDRFQDMAAASPAGQLGIDPALAIVGLIVVLALVLAGMLYARKQLD